MDINNLSFEEIQSPPRLRSHDPSDSTLVKANDLQTDNLCERCKVIDFHTVLFGERDPPKYHNERQDVVEDLGPVKDWAVDSCVFCKALADLIPLENRTNSPPKYALHSVSTENSTWLQHIFALLTDIPGRVMLMMDDTGFGDRTSKFLIPQTSSPNVLRVLDSSAVDYQILEGWLSLCKTMHTTNCSTGDRKMVKYLKFLDCETRKLVPADSLPYVTLSYMWGANEIPPIYTEQLGTDLPPTIEDSITVTLKLGFRHLWIDRYCINQQNKQQAMSQIQQMDLIYENSEVTIVAAAGVGPTYGLPGVSRPRLPQPVANIGNIQLVSPGSAAKRILDTSRWSTRGWTFQEAYLSRRRLTFTDEQVFYECGGMYSYESMDIPLAKMHTEDGQTLDSKYFDKLYGKIVVFPGGVGHEALDIFDRIIDFSTKSLTYTSDKLNGFMGIAKAFEMGPHRVRSIWGSPILPKPDGKTEPTDQNYHVTELFSSMCWIYGDSVRIPSLPSWSWVGWDGDLFFGYMGDFQPLNLNPPPKISIELTSGQILDWDTYHETYANVNSLTNVSQFIHISTYTFPIRILKRKGPSCRCQLDMRDGCYLTLRFDPHDSRSKGDSCTGLLMVDNRDPNVDRMIFVLIVAEIDGRMERVGGSWLPMECILYDGDDEQVVRKGEMYEDKYTKYADLVERYGEEWYLGLVGSYETFRLG